MRQRAEKGWRLARRKYSDILSDQNRRKRVEKTDRKGDDKKYSFMCRISQERVWGRARGDNGLGGLEAHIRLPNPLRPARYNVVSTLARLSP